MLALCASACVCAWRVSGQRDACEPRGLPPQHFRAWLTVVQIPVAEDVTDATGPAKGLALGAVGVAVDQQAGMGCLHPLAGHRFVHIGPFRGCLRLLVSLAGGAHLAGLIQARIGTSRELSFEAINARSLPVKLRDGVARLFAPYL